MSFVIRTVLRSAVLVAAVGIVLFIFRFPVMALLVLFAAAWRRRGWRGSGYAHGTASFASLLSLARFGMLGKSGLIVGKTGYASPLGRMSATRALFSNALPSAVSCRLFLSTFLGPRWSGDATIRLQDFTHLVAFAPTGRGKGVSLVIPNLLSYAGSAVVTDVKGELFAQTSLHRQRRFGHRVVILDPFHVCGPASDCLNPLDFIDATTTDFLDQCRDLANALILRKGTEHEPHWNDSAELILTAFIAFVCACEGDPAERNLMTVRHLLASKSKYTHAVEVMQQSDAAGGVIRKLGELCTWFIEKEGASVMTTLHRQTGWIDSPAVAAVMARSSFDPRGLKSGKMDIYLVLPPERLASLPAVMRMWLDTLLRVLARDGASERNKILFLLDEIGHLGHIQSLENAVTMMRGYGIRLFFFFQSIGQVRDCFGDRASKFLDNIDTQIFFGLNAYESSEYVSKMMGDETIVTQSYNRTTSRSGSDRATAGDHGGQWSLSSSITHSELGRPLMRPDEILRAPEDFGLLLHRNLPVVPLRLIRYFSDPDFRNGRTGASRGPGTSALLAASLLLSLSVCLPIAAVSLPEPRRLPPPVVVAPMPPLAQPAPGFSAPLPSPFGNPTSPYGPGGWMPPTVSPATPRPFGGYPVPQRLGGRPVDRLGSAPPSLNRSSQFVVPNGGHFRRGR